MDGWMVELLKRKSPHTFYMFLFLFSANSVLALPLITLQMLRTQNFLLSRCKWMMRRHTHAALLIQIHRIRAKAKAYTKLNWTYWVCNDFSSDVIWNKCKHLDEMMFCFFNTLSLVAPSSTRMQDETGQTLRNGTMIGPFFEDQV